MLDAFKTNGSSPPQADVRVDLHCSLALVQPLTPEAQFWIDDNVQSDAQWWAGALVVEPRYLRDLVCGMAEAGFRISGGRA